MFKDDIDLSLRVGWKLNNTGSRPSTDAWMYWIQKEYRQTRQPESAASIINL